MLSGTPTNPTPPDSLTSEDSSYVSAKDSQLSRVRFSPVTCDPRETILGHPNSTQEITSPLSPLQTSRRLSRSRKPSISEIDRDFLT